MDLGSFLPCPGYAGQGSSSQMDASRRLIVLSLLLASSLHALEVPHGFETELLATNLNAATAIAPSPDGRIFIADQTGKLRVCRNGTVSEQPVLTLHVTDYWERGLIGLALHPEFPQQQIFVLYVTDRPFVHHVLSRFTLKGDAADPASEQVLLEGDDQAKLGGTIPAGHQGGPLRFGLDGKIYVGIGEQTAGEPSQRLNTLQGKILRLNIDGSIPSDNPFFASASNKYRAIYAYGIRNPFGLAIQPETRRIFFTDVGGSAYEEINELIAGANYGWPLAEGFSTNSTFKQPLHAYPPPIGQSIIGGAFIPQTSSWPEKWRGKFFFGDFMKHWIKALDPDAPTNAITFARGLNGPVAIELAPDGSLLVLNRGAVWRDPRKFVENAGSLLRIRYTGNNSAEPLTKVSARPDIGMAALAFPMSPEKLPRKISREEWDRKLRSGNHWPIAIHATPWHPLVEETASLFLPEGRRATLRGVNEDVVLPPGAVVVRDFRLNETSAQPAAQGPTSRLIETRVLVVGEPHGYGVSYRWLNETEAELIEDGESVNLRADARKGKIADSSWWFPAIDDRISFPVTNPPYWVSTAPLDFGGSYLIEMLRKDALETELSLETIAKIPSGNSWENRDAPLEIRVRSYLHQNCAVCHQPGSAARGSFDARITTPLRLAGILNGEVAAGDLGIAGAKIIVPGQPEKSILYLRMKSTDFFRMPPTQLQSEPAPILPLLEAWIRGLSAGDAETTSPDSPK